MGKNSTTVSGNDGDLNIRQVICNNDGNVFVDSHKCTNFELVYMTFKVKFQK